MLWPILTFIALAGLLAVYWRGRARLRECERGSRLQLERLEQARTHDLADAQARVETLLNGMVEGVLLLDEKDRIQMANRAFATLFGLSRDVRSLTILEALRQHELSDLVQSLSHGDPVATRELKLLQPERILQVNAAAILNAAGR